ncbi:MAG: class I SAM-dependent methyltransferase [Acidimicrobiales bacterium]
MIWAMSRGGTASYAGQTGLPPLVQAAVELAERERFDLSCQPDHGRLLQVLVRGRRGGLVGETGTGCGVGLAWMVEAAGPDTTFVSVDQNGSRARAAAQLFADRPNVTIIHGDWKEIRSQGPFDLLVLDGGGGGKDQEAALDPANGWLRPNGMVVLDDFTPKTGWPPMHNNDIDRSRLYWLDHPALKTTEIQVGHTSATLVGVLK